MSCKFGFGYGGVLSICCVIGIVIIVKCSMSFVLFIFSMNLLC